MKYKVMLAKLGSRTDLDRKDYIYEPKLDGYRALCYVNQQMHFFSRNGMDVTVKYPSIAVRSSVRARSCVLDGEIIAFNKKGIIAFQALQQGNPAYYIVFDILEKNGRSLIHLPLYKHKKILEQTIKDSIHFKQIFFTQYAHALFKEAKKFKLEGVMAKKFDGRYYPGERKNVWLKVKFHMAIDAVIIGYTQEKRAISSLALGLYDQKGILHHIGNVGTGFSEKNIKQIYHVLRSIKTDKSPPHDAKYDDVIWVKPKYVSEIKLAEMTRDRKVRQAVFLDLRDDKKPKECTFKDQV